MVSVLAPLCWVRWPCFHTCQSCATCLLSCVSATTPQPSDCCFIHDHQTCAASLFALFIPPTQLLTLISADHPALLEPPVIPPPPFCNPPPSPLAMQASPVLQAYRPMLNPHAQPPLPSPSVYAPYALTPLCAAGIPPQDPDRQEVAHAHHQADWRHVRLYKPVRERVRPLWCRPQLNLHLRCPGYGCCQRLQGGRMRAAFWLLVPFLSSPPVFCTGLIITPV